MFMDQSSDPPPPEQRFPLSVYRPTLSRPVELLIRTRWYHGFFTHYVDNRNVACPQPQWCVACNAGQSRRWAGAFIASNLRRTDNRLLIITASCLDEMLQYSDEQEGFSSKVFRFWREAGEKRRRLHVQLVKKLDSPCTLYGMEVLRENLDRIFKPYQLLTPAGKKMRFEAMESTS